MARQSPRPFLPPTTHLRPPVDGADFLRGGLAVTCMLVFTAVDAVALPQPDAGLTPLLQIIGTVLAAGAGGSVVLLRRHPLVPFFLSLLATVFPVLSMAAVPPAALLLPVALWGVAARCAPLLVHSALALSTVMVILLTMLLDRRTLSTATVLVVAATALASMHSAATLGWHHRLTRQAAFTAATQAAAAGDMRAHEAAAAAATERTRIAREMHDIVAHSLSVVIAQADGGRYAAAADPAAAERALTTIAEIGRAALTDMRAILGVLRTPETDALERLPQPMDADMDSLINNVVEAGLPTSIVRVGPPHVLPPGLGLAVHRVVQESLTNALKYAGPTASATVLLQWTASALILVIEDNGRGVGATSDGRGHGLIGMRERVAAFGGALEAGARQGGGFRVRAHIPLGPLPATRPAPAPPEAPAPPSQSPPFSSVPNPKDPS